MKWPNTCMITVLTMLALTTGCNTIGPRSIDAGRSAYAEAITRTEDEQILLSVVKGRYGESPSLLQVNSIAANIRFRADAGAEVGFTGPVNNPGENLIIGGLAYEENPTITYTPVQGEQYVQQLFTPISLDLFLLVIRSSSSSDFVFNLLANRVNDLRNPDFLEGPQAEPDLRFARFVELFTQLHRSGILELAGSTEGKGKFAVLLQNDKQHATEELAEIVSLLGLTVPEDNPEDLVLPINLAIKRDHSWSMAISTRSTFDLIEIMRASVEVPEAHQEAGWAISFPPSALQGATLKIHSSPNRPDHASRAIQYRGYWFFIDDADHETKFAFNLLRSLWSISIAAGSDYQNSVPVLTIPVSQ